jgi:DNA-binding response OmpR family regulator
MTYKVVVADNSPSAQRAVQLALPEPEFEIHMFGDGWKVIQALPDINPDAVLLSLQLPSMDGYDVGLYLRTQEAFNQCALILLRGAFEALDLRKISPVEYDGLIQKPFDSDSLFRLVRDALEKRKEIPSFPEEPLLDDIALPENPPEDIPQVTPEWTDELEKKIHEVVKKEIRKSTDELEDWTREIVSSEFKKMLVEELKAIEKK